VADFSDNPPALLASLDEWCAWLLPRFKPTTFLTLEWDTNRFPSVTVDRAYWWFARLVEMLNQEMLGLRYRRKCKHSYFSYLVVHEMHVKGNIHLHVLIDNWVDYALIHKWWNAHCGFAWTSTIPCTDPRKVFHGNTSKTESMAAAVRYCLKYVLKTSVSPRLWITNKRWDVGRIVRMPEPPPFEYGSALADREAAAAAAIAETTNFEKLGY